MSAIEPLGYPDWQRLTNWDGPVLYSLPVANYTTTQTSPALRVDRYHSVAGYLPGGLGGGGEITFNWYADQGLTTLLGFRYFNIDAANVSQFMQYRLPNLGAWLQVVVTVGVSPFRYSLVLAASNRLFSKEVVPRNPFVFDVQNAVIGAGATLTFYMHDVVGGRAHLWGFGPKSAFEVALLAYNGAGGYDYIWQGFSDGNGEMNADVNLPQSTVRVDMANQSAAGVGCYCSIVCDEE